MATTPDFRPYVDLRFADTDAQSIFDDAIARAQTLLPEWTPREGNIEVVLLEAASVIAEGVVFAVNRLPDTILGGLGALMGVAFYPGARPTATVTFTCSDTAGHTIPSGTLVRYQTIGARPVEVIFQTDSALTVAPGASTGTVAVTATTYTQLANGAAAGTALDIVSPIPYLERAALATVIVGGADSDTATRYLERVVQRLARLTTSYVRPSDIEQRILDTYPQVVRSRVIQRWDGVSLSPGSDLGFTTVAAAGSNGSPLSAGDKAIILADLQEGSPAHLAIRLVDITPLTIPVTASVRKRAGYSDATVLADVTAVLNEYLSFTQWVFGATVEPGEVFARIDTAVSVDLVNSVTLPAVPVTPTPTQLPVLGTVTLTIVAA
jgi:hypothetical protein